MCKELEEELSNGDKVFKEAAIHLYNMGACSTEQEIKLPGVAETFVISVKRLPLRWECKNCGENEKPACQKCVREDGKLVTDELVEG